MNIVAYNLKTPLRKFDTDLNTFNQLDARYPNQYKMVGGRISLINRIVDKYKLQLQDLEKDIYDDIDEAVYYYCELWLPTNKYR